MTETRTLADLLALPAGRTLDGYIADLCSEEVNWDTGQPSVWRSGLWLEPLPRSQAIAAAWPLLAEMLAAHIIMRLWFIPDLGLSVTAVNTLFGDAEVPAIVDAPLAICRVWLAWFYGKRGEA